VLAEAYVRSGCAAEFVFCKAKLLARFSMLVVSMVLLSSIAAQAQSWTALQNPPRFGVSLCLLLTDGTVICQSGGAWQKLTPNLSGSYVNGSWSRIANFPSSYVPDAYASAVLADGRVVAVGGEYNNGSFVLTNAGAIYDPVANTWTSLPTPPNIQFVGDAPAVVLANGSFLIGSKLDQNMAVLDPSTLTWAAINETGKIDGFNSEEGWVLLPDESVFTLDVKNAPSAERFIPSTSAWVSAGPTPVDLHTPTTSTPIQVPGGPVYFPPGEIGPDLLLPNGTVFAIGANGATAIYTPSTNSWTMGPLVPFGLHIEDGPGAVLPNGHVLFGASPVSGSGLQYFEFDGLSLISVPAPSGTTNDATFGTVLLVLPTGQVMFGDSSRVEIYTPASSSSDSSWAPTITSAPTTIESGTTYPITGTQFNGLSQGSAFGDESQNATNYPLVRITNNASGHVFYARTHGHSTMGVATGSTPVSTNFDVPGNIEGGSSSLVVVANGIASQPVNVSVTAPTATASMTRTPTSTPTATISSTPTPTRSATPTATATATASATRTATATLTAMATATRTATVVATATISATATLTATPTATPSSMIVFVAQGPLADFSQPVTAVPVSRPAGVQAGDIFIAQIVVYDATGSNVPTAPLGWSVIRHDSVSSTNRMTSWLYYRVAGASEPGACTWNIASQYAAGIMGAWRGASVSPIDQDSGSIAVGTSPVSDAAPSMTPASDNELQVYFYGSQNASAPTITEPAAITQRANIRSLKEGFALAFGDIAAPFAGNPSPTYIAKSTFSSAMPVMTGQAVLLLPANQLVPTPTATATDTATPTASATATPTATATATITATVTATATGTASATATHTAVATATATGTATATATQTVMATATATQTATANATPIPSVSFVAHGPLTDSSAPVTTVTVSLPSGIQSSDLLLAHIAVYDATGTNVPTAPAGWSVIRHDSVNNGNKMTSWLYFRIAGVSEPGSYTWIIASQYAAGLMSGWRGASASPIDQSSGSTASGNSPISAAAPSLTPAGNNELQVYFYGSQSVSAPTITEPGTINQRADIKSAKEGFTLADGDLAAPSAGNTSPTYTAIATTFTGNIPVMTAQAVLLKPGP
jgi:hypothetical protein